MAGAAGPENYNDTIFSLLATRLYTYIIVDGWVAMIVQLRVYCPRIRKLQIKVTA